jgi:copper chaperone
MKYIVEGMTCAHCERAITKAIHAIDSQAPVEVDVAGGVVIIGNRVDAGLATAAIEAEGYRVVSVQEAKAACCGSCHV